MHRQSGAKRVTIRSGKPFDTVHFIAITGKREIGGRGSTIDPANSLAVQEIKLLDKEGVFAWQSPLIKIRVIDNILYSPGSYGAGSKRSCLPGMELEDLNSNGSGRVVQAPKERLGLPVSFGARGSDFVDNLDETIWKKPDYGAMTSPQDTSGISPRVGPWKKPTKVKVIWCKDASGTARVIENKGYGKLLFTAYVDVEKQSGIPIGRKSGGSSGYDGDVSESITEKKKCWKKWTVRISKLVIGIGCIAIIFWIVIIVIEILRAHGFTINLFWDPFKQARGDPDWLFLFDQAPKSG